MLNFYTGAISGDSAAQSPSSAKATQENVIELSYIVQLTDHFQIQPDLQWIIQPGGYSGAASSLVVGFQVAAQF
jgi:porin